VKLNKLTDHALRVLIYLASLEADKLATITEVTTAFSLSRDSVTKLVQKMAKAGFIKAIRGKSGGIRLGLAADEINLRAVVELMEPTLAPVNCAQPSCILSKNCELKTILFTASEQFLSHIGQFTLADVSKPNSDTVYVIKSLND